MLFRSGQNLHPLVAARVALRRAAEAGGGRRGTPVVADSGFLSLRSETPPGVVPRPASFEEAALLSPYAVGYDVFGRRGTAEEIIERSAGVDPTALYAAIRSPAFQATLARRQFAAASPASVMPLPFTRTSRIT